MRKMNFRSPLFLFSVALIVALSCALPFLFAQHPHGAKGGGKNEAKGGEGGIPEMKPMAVLVAQVGTTVPVISRDIPGTTEAIESVRVIARISGQLENVAFQEGDIVKKGDLLFNIEETEYAANLRAAKAQVVSGESRIKQYEAKILEITAKVRYAETNYSRCRQLFERGGAGSQNDVDNALSTLDSEKAQLEAAKASLTDALGQLELAKAKVDLAEFDMSHTKIYSPIQGRAGRLSFTQGNFITPNDGALVTVAQLDPIYIRFSLSETDFVSLFESADTLRETTELKVLLADNSVYSGKGKIKFIDNRITKLDTLQVWAEFENPDGILNPGGIAKVILTKPGKDELPSIAASGILHDKSGEFVYVVGENNMLEKRTIELGPANGNTQCVVKGLSVGEVVLIGGTNKVIPGMPINPIFDQETLKQLEEEEKNAAGEGEGVSAQPGAPQSPVKNGDAASKTPVASASPAASAAPASFDASASPGASDSPGLDLIVPAESDAEPSSAARTAAETKNPTAHKVPLTLTPSSKSVSVPEKKGENR